MKPPSKDDLPALEAFAREAVRGGNAEAIALAADWIGTTPAALKIVVKEDERERLEAATGGRAPVLVRLADVQPEPVRWLWPGRLALGKLTLIAGDPGLGKSYLTLDMAARVSTGAGWPDAPGQRFESGGVVLLSAEDDLADTVRPRLDAAGADCSRITALQAVEHTDPGTGATIKASFTLADMPALEAAIKETPDCRLVVIDPISAYMAGTDSHVNAEVRAALAPLSELAARHGLAVVAVTHLRKGEGAAIYRAMGSMAFVAAARAAWAVSRDGDDPTKRRRLFLPIKNNLGNDQSGLAFELCDTGTGVPALAWAREPVAVSVDDALAPPERGKPGPEADGREAAERWLRGALAAGPRLSQELIPEAREALGVSEKTLRRAAVKAGVDCQHRPVNPGPFYWRLDGETCPSAPTSVESVQQVQVPRNSLFPGGQGKHLDKSPVHGDPLGGAA